MYITEILFNLVLKMRYSNCFDSSQVKEIELQGKDIPPQASNGAPHTLQLLLLL
jgi:hypothetical protein